MEALMLLVMGITNIVCFVIGAKLGQIAAKGKDIVIPEVNPIKAIKEHNERREAEVEAEMEQSRIDTILQNIEGYDGTPFGQKDVPGKG